MKKLLFAALVITNFIMIGQSQSKFIYSSNPGLKSDAEKLNMSVEQLQFNMEQNALNRIKLYNGTSSSRSTSSVNPACSNMDFETGNTTGWTINSGTTMAIGNSCNPASFTTTSTTFSVLSNGFIDPFMPTMQINSQFGATGNGNKFLKLNDQFAGGNQQQLSQSFSVTTSNNLFQYAYMYVTDLGGHTCCDQPFFTVRFLNSLNQPLNILLANFTVTPTFSCNPTYSQTVSGMTVCPGNANFVYTPWIQGAADLTPFIGSFVTFELTVGDCSSAGHPSYCYFDSKCSPLTFLMNGNPTQLDSTNNICASSLPMNLNAPNGFQNYAWAGPNSSLTQSINANAYGSYTLTMNALATCCPIKKIFNISPCTGITEITTKSNDIFIYPNPSNDHITFENAIGEYEYQIYDLFGKLIEEKEKLPENKTIRISNLDAGVYFIKLYKETDSKGKTYKIIKE